MERERLLQEVEGLKAEVLRLRCQEQAVIAYVREKTDQLLGVMGTLPLKPEELDDETLLLVDPIGIVSESFVQVLEHLRETEGRLQEIIATVQTGIMLVDATTHRIIDINELAVAITGYSKEELIGSSCQKTICPGNGPCPLTHLGRGIDRRECVVLHADGHQVPILKAATHVSLNGKPHLLESFIDISQLKQTEEALRVSEERYHSLYRTMREGVALHEIIRNAAGEPVDYRILDINPSYEAILGLDRNTVIGRAASEVYGELPPPGLDIYTQVAEFGNAVSFEMVFGEEQRTFSISAVSPARDKFATIFEDITMRKRAEQEIQQLAFFDLLTQLPNRTLLMDRLGQALAQAARNEQQAAVLFLDIDRFKAINDTLGHATGDQLLKVVAERLNSCIRKSDTVARVGGDEFVIILNAVNHQQAVIATAEKILASLSAPVELEGHEICGSGSLGIAIYPVDGQDVITLLKNADMAMYRAKDMGRNMFQFYTREMNTQAMDRLVLGNDLRRANERGELYLHYHPQVDLASGRVRGIEALLRWRHPELGDIPPSKFIPIAEETGRIIDIGYWTLEIACRQAKSWHDAGYPWLQVAVNLSAQQFRQPGLPAMVEKILSATGLCPGALELELTESTVMTSAEENRQMLRTLKDMGLLLAIDDFGTGYSSLSYLKHFPIDRLKIDRSFVHDIIDNANSATIAKAIITLAHSLKIKVVAEGVETRQQMEFLRELNCDEIQGYYFCRPSSGEELNAMLACDDFFTNLVSRTAASA